MFNNQSLPGNSGFSIWFNKKDRKEYYTTSITNAKIKFANNINFKYKEILLLDDSTNFLKSNTLCNIVNRDFSIPLEERYGMFLIRFLNANFSDIVKAFRTFFAFYGLGFLNEYIQDLPRPTKDQTTGEYFQALSQVYINAKDALISLQKEIRDCVDFTYNLNGSNSYSDEYPYIRYLSYAMKENLYKYQNKTTIHFNTLFLNGSAGFSQYTASPIKVSKSIKDGTLNFRTSNIYHSNYLSNIVFISLNEIAMNTYVTIKKCQNCGKYFIPLSKESEIYCDITYYYKQKSCRIKGAAETFKKSIGDIEAYQMYKKTYQRILMQIQRGKINPYSEKAKYFTQWKQTAQQRLKLYKQGKANEQELSEWMQNSIDKFDKYDEKHI